MHTAVIEESEVDNPQIVLDKLASKQITPEEATALLTLHYRSVYPRGVWRNLMDLLFRRGRVYRKTV